MGIAGIVDRQRSISDQGSRRICIPQGDAEKLFSLIRKEEGYIMVLKKDM